MMKRNVSRAAALALAGTMMLGLAACGAPELVNDGSPRPEQEQQVEEKDKQKQETEKQDVSGDIDDAIAGRDATEESPAAIGQWVEMARYSAADSTYHTVYVRVTDVVTQSEDSAAIDAAIAEHNGYGYDFEQIDLSQVQIPDDVEPCLLKYEVYVPDDFPVAEYGGITEPSLYFSESNIGGGGIPAPDGTTYIGLGSNNETLLTEGTNNDTEYVPGQTYAFTDLFFMVKGYDGYVFDTDSYDAGTTDETTNVDAMYSVCFACK